MPKGEDEYTYFLEPEDHKPNPDIANILIGKAGKIINPTYITNGNGEIVEVEYAEIESI
jgi:hypothetical protein